MLWIARWCLSSPIIIPSVWQWLALCTDHFTFPTVLRVFFWRENYRVWCWGNVENKLVKGNLFRVYVCLTLKFCVGYMLYAQYVWTANLKRTFSIPFINYRQPSGQVIQIFCQWKQNWSSYSQWNLDFFFIFYLKASSKLKAQP